MNNILSEEQQLIVDLIPSNKNIIVDACAGSGKSTTVLSIAIAYPHKKLLLITYNHSLRKEMQEKVKELGITNIQVHTYHSLAFSIYSKDAGRDKGMRKVIVENIKPRISIPYLDILVLDEVQDMTLLYFRFILKYIKDKGEPFQLVVLGDYMQGLYEFKGADIRFLTKSGELWSKTPLLVSSECVDCSLKTSYRVTNQIASFVNQGMLGFERLKACRDGAPVLYIRGRIERLQEKVVKIIKQLLASGAQPGDIFVLGASVRDSNSIVKRIENALVEGNIPCHVPMIENGEIDENVIKGKVVFSTFHSSKGRQRPYVFIVGFDHSYFQIARELDPHICPNTLYVACTRASQQLFLLESYDRSSDRPLKFLKFSHKQMMQLPFMTFDGIAQDEFVDDTIPFANKSEITICKTSPTNLTKFISEPILDKIREILTTIFMPVHREPLMPIDLPTVIQTQSGFFEDVSDLNGIAIPNMFYDSILSEYEEDPTTILYSLIKSQLSRGLPKDNIFLKRCFKNIQPVCETVGDYLYMANMYQACQERLYFKLNQIKKEEYTWLSPKVLSQCKQRFIDTFQEEIENYKPEMEWSLVDYGDEDANIEFDRILMPHFPNKQIRFSARVDFLTEKTLWELKCTSELSEEHLIQTVVYAWILRTIDPENDKSVKIMNIRTGEILLLEAEKGVLDTIMLLLLESKYGKREPIPDADFLEGCCMYI